MFGNAIAGWALLTIVENALTGLSSQLFSFIQNEWSGIFLAPIPLAILHAYFDLFSGLIQTSVFISLTAIFIGQEIPEEINYGDLTRKEETL